MILFVLFSALASFLAVNWIYFKVLKIAKDKEIVDNPEARKLQKVPIPVMGGIAVFFGIVAGGLTGAVAMTISGEGGILLLLPIVASMVMLYVGAIDDVVGLTPVSRLVIEVLVVLALIFASGRCVDSFHGLFFIKEFSWWIAVPLTVFSSVGFINAINMIDGVNGLSSGLCMVCSGMFGMAFVHSGDMANAVLAFSMVGSLFPFFMHNVFGKHSRMFIGDGGTMVMGVAMSWFVINLLYTGSFVSAMMRGRYYNMIAFCGAVLSVPIADTLRVMMMRMLKGRSPFSPDKTHLHHAFIKVGVSHSITALSEIFIDMMVVLIWALSVKVWHVGLVIQLLVVIVTGLILVWGTYAFLAYHIDRQTKTYNRLNRIGLATHLGHKNWWMKLQHWLDAPEMKTYEEEREKNRADHKERRFHHETLAG